jgi:hypothetical protein
MEGASRGFGPILACQKRQAKMGHPAVVAMPEPAVTETRCSQREHRVVHCGARAVLVLKSAIRRKPPMDGGFRLPVERG